ncbi:tRNA lysidine(34) synthetase TilS [uncultured Erythrobacter sp.]|uniref:tRNA lysidine(34) synthetase TilS n=1 Tax=uncultured Erythrobacter sp. TaxID=263913 RepID=UPI002632B2FF|nr:tRNA lysidine(34) synthetase TilS [uncultured Erythrobacter sp.]
MDERTGPLGLAVSGGPDSLALLLLANDAIPGEIAVASVDHGLRPEAADEVALVKAVCNQHDIPFTGLSTRVGAGNLQAKAREARYRVLTEWVRDKGIGALATAHHADDQAETLLMRLARGSGLSGLAGVRAAAYLTDGETPLLRPLLGFRKAELKELVATSGIQAVSDPSNEDTAFDRVRIRQHLANHEWLGVDALAASAENLAEAWRAIEWYAGLDWDEMVHREDAAAFRYYVNVPRVIAVETICRIIGELGGLATRSEAARAYDRLWRDENASLSGVLIVPGAERIEPTGVTMRVWRFAPEPPRNTN